MLARNDTPAFVPPMTESDRSYFAPPIIDATIELRFQDTLSAPDRERASKKFASRYPSVEHGTLQQILVNVHATGLAAQANVQEHLTRRRTTESPYVLQIGDHVFDVATSAPYSGWLELFDRFVEDWAIAKRVWKYRPIQRIGMRYINRIDLEPNEHGLVDYEDYLNLRINLPETFPPTTAYELGFQSTVESIKCGVTVQSGTAQPAVPGKQSFTLDIDLWRQVDVPQKDADVLELLQEMRKAKNVLFETFITDKARELFNAH
jgi:uncharacterized protein (TIGR04255 family)